MPKCNKIKKPCKICLGPVSQKTGLQCQGACQSWVHYECLNYTPGKIKDVKAGVITVSCPCPDCKTKLPKEYRTEEPFSCSNIKCPANHPPKCGNVECPTGGHKEQPPVATGCALNKCGKSCKQNSTPLGPEMTQQQPMQPCAPPHYPLPVSPQDSSDACIDYNACPSGCASNKDIPGDYPRPNTPSYGALEQMCNTVGQLTNQINNLMYQMKEVVEEKQYGVPRSTPKEDRKAQRPLDPKPCYCPGNPARQSRQ